MEAMRLLLDSGADVNEKNNVSTCECTLSVIGSLVCLSDSLSICLSL